MELPGLTSLLDNYLGLQENEKVGILYDSARKDMREMIEKSLKARGHVYKSAPFEHRSGSYTSKAIKLMENPEFPVIILTSVRSIWHHPARKRAKYELGKRMTSIICEISGFEAGYCTADPMKMELLGNHIATLIKPGVKVRITSHAGTDVEAVVEIPFLETGVFNRSSTGGNWPSGEIGFGPREGTVNGVIVYDLKFKHLGKLDKKNAKVTVEKDRCVRYEGEGGEALEEIFNMRDRALHWVGEVAMGLNYAFDRNINGDIVVETDPRTIVEEKAIGTAHFGHGGNLSFGKRTGDHADGVLTSPSVTIDGITLMIDGKFSPDAAPDDVCKWLEEIDMLI